MAISYKDAGVDVEAGYEAVRLMREDVKSTYNDSVLTSLANFGGLFSLKPEDIAGEPVLVAGADGVGTKLKVAVVLDRHDTIGIDCVAMCVNDIACQGARPLFFLDYIAVDRLQPERVAKIVKGVATACRECGCVLLGGETAEMPGLYRQNEYDVAGFAVGIADKSKLIDGGRIAPGDALIGLESSGLHSNGFSLVRRLFMMDAMVLNRHLHALGSTLSKELMRPTRLYVKPMLELREQFDIRGAAHITGGGFIENIPRMLPSDCYARIQLGSWPQAAIFDLIRGEGDLTLEMMYNTFNMGIGLVLAVPAEQAKAAVDAATNMGYPAHLIGEVAAGGEGVEFWSK